MTRITSQFGSLRRQWLLAHQSGFTLIEKMILVAVIGIFGAVMAPNLSRMLDRVRVDQATSEVRSALDETQREAIRGNKSCVVTLDLVQANVTGTCLQAGNRRLPRRVSLVTNMLSNLDVSSPSKVTAAPSVTDTEPRLGLSGTGATPIAMAADTSVPKASMVIQIISQSPRCSKSDDDDDGGGADDCQEQDTTVVPIPIQYGALGTPNFAVKSEVAVPEDPSGKIVFYLEDNEQVAKRCIAISNTLGLTRIGSYEGALEPAAITDQGECAAAGWETQ